MTFKIKELMQKLDFPIDAQNELLLILDVFLQDNDFINIVKCYDKENYDFNTMLTETKTLAENKGINVYTAHMLLLLCLTPMLHNKYKQKGIDDKIFYDTIRDFKYKLEECRLVHNVNGTFVAAWYKGFFEMRIFELGRLQFEINHTWFDCDVDGQYIPKGTKVLSVHIPRTNTRLEHSLVKDSYKRALEFFKEEFEGSIIFICSSWLLYPWNRQILRDNSNLAQFYDDFTIVSSGEYQNYNEVWRLFDCLYDGNPNNLPNDTSLRRAYIERINTHQPIGYGTGVIIK